MGFGPDIPFEEPAAADKPAAIIFTNVVLLHKSALEKRIVFNIEHGFILYYDYSKSLEVEINFNISEYGSFHIACINLRNFNPNTYDDILEIQMCFMLDSRAVNISIDYDKLYVDYDKEHTSMDPESYQFKYMLSIEKITNLIKNQDKFVKFMNRYGPEIKINGILLYVEFYNMFSEFINMKKAIPRLNELHFFEVCKLHEAYSDEDR